MSDSDQQDMSMGQFLFSKEGRGTLIMVVSVILVTLFAGYYVWGSIFSSSDNQQTTAEDIAGGGSSTVTTRSQQNIQADLTSENMTDEARSVAEQFNEQTATDDRLHPVPTADDVQRVAVPGIPKEGEADAQSELERETTLRPLTRAPGTPGDRNNRSSQNQQGTADTRAQRAERDRMAEEYMRARREAASGLIRTYEQVPASASISFSSGSDGNGEGDNLARVARDSEGNTRFEKANSNGSQNESQCEYPLVKGGDIRYAVNSIALNTDFQGGPVKVEFLDGKLKGWIGIGSYELNEFGAKMMVMIEQLIDPTGGKHEVTGYVLDPETTLWATASDVDYHIIYRYGGYGLGTILAGFSELADARETRSTRVGVNGDTQTEFREPDGKQITWRLLGSFSQLWEEAFRDNINRPITVTLDPNAELGVLFRDSVCISKQDPVYRFVEMKQIRREGFSDPVQQ